MKIDKKGFKSKPSGYETGGITSRMVGLPEIEYYNPLELSRDCYNGKSIIFDNVKAADDGLFRRLKKNCIGTRYIGIDIDAAIGHPIKDMDEIAALLDEIGIKWSFRYKTFSYGQPEYIDVIDSFGKPKKDSNNEKIKEPTGRIKRNHRYLIHIDETLSPYEALAFYKWIENKFGEHNVILDKSCCDLVRIWYAGKSEHNKSDTPFNTMKKSEVLNLASKELENITQFFNSDFGKSVPIKKRTVATKNKVKQNVKRKEKNLTLINEPEYVPANYDVDFEYYGFQPIKKDISNDQALLDFIKDTIDEWVDYSYVRDVLLALTIFESVGEAKYAKYFIECLEPKYKSQYMYYIIDARNKQYLTTNARKIYESYKKIIINDSDDYDEENAIETETKENILAEDKFIDELSF